MSKIKALRVEKISLHQRMPVLSTGVPLGKARLAVVMLHGRGATARDILTLAPEFDTPEAAYLAPQAAGFSWYPQRFLAPIQENEPWLSSALEVISSLVAQMDGAGIPPERTVLVGFSQGACLGLEWAARNARRFGGIAGLSGGLIGPDGTARDYTGSLDGTPVFLGCSDVDPHIPKERVIETAEVMRKLDGQVEMRLYPNMGHMVNEDEIKAVRNMLKSMDKQRWNS